MEENSRVELSQAIRAYNANMNSLQTSCSCSLCVHDKEDFSYNFCVKTLLETIITLAQLLSYTNVAEGLFPTRSGLEALYFRQKEESMITIFSSKDKKPQAMLGRSLDLFKHNPLNLGIILSNVLQLFSYRHISVVGFASAYSSSGVCVFLSSLCDISDTRTQVCLLNVVSGSIEHRSKPYLLVKDRGSGSVISITDDPKISSSDDITLLVTPGMEHLEVEYEVRRNGLTSIRIPPATYACELLCIQQPTQCEKRTCPPVQTSKPRAISPLHQQLDLGSKTINVIYGNTLHRCILIALYEPEDYQKRILGTNACLSCSLTLAMQLSGNEIWLIRDQLLQKSDKWHYLTEES